MLKERKLLQYDDMYKIGDTLYEKGNKTVLGWYTFDSYLGGLSVCIKEDKTKPHIESEEYYFTEFESEAFESDYHSYSQTYNFKGVLLAFNLNIPNTNLYFGEDFKSMLFPVDEFLNQITLILQAHKLISKYDNHEIGIDHKWEHEEDGYHLKIILLDKKLDENIINCSKEILEFIRTFLNNLNIHITRMFGSYILLKNINGNLTAVKATPIPIKYCPLMAKLLKEVGGPIAESLLQAINTSSLEIQAQKMCELINETVIKTGYFATDRPLNSCEANVLFGASESISSAFKNNMIDASVIVSNNLGTIITTNAPSTQGAVKRMTGLFYTSPSSEIVDTAQNAGIIPVFPYTAEIDQLEGLKMAISLGYKKIAVSVAATDNYLHAKISELERENNVTIYKFGLCSTGISEKAALAMKNHADVVWSCASKQVKEHIEPNAIAQVGIKIPVHIMTEKGWDIIKNHLSQIGSETSLENIDLQKGDEKPILLNNDGLIRVLKKKELHECSDCPHPCI